MRRANLSEIHEQPWFPSKLRDDVTDTLQFILNLCRMYRSIAPRLGGAIRAAGATRVVDLCSGAGGPWSWLCGDLASRNGGRLEVTLTDRYPNVAAFRRAQAASVGAIGFCDAPVDAQEIPSQLHGFRTIFSSVHHFTPDEVVAILRDAVARGEGVGLFEAAKRRPLNVLSACLMPLAALVFVPLMRPFRFPRLVWTYLLPVIPFVLLFDGVLSCLRAYSIPELRELATLASANHYAWDIGDVGRVTYFLGYPAPRPS